MRQIDHRGDVQPNLLLLTLCIKCLKRAIRPKTRIVDKECDAAVKNAADAAFQILCDGISASQRAGLLRTEQSVEMLALALGSTMHGLTVLFLDSILIKEKPSFSIEEKVQTATQIMHMMAQGLVARQ